MINVLGCAAAFCGCTAVGMMAASHKEKRASALRELSHLLSRIEVQTAWMGEPLPKVLSALSEEAPVFGALLEDVSSTLKQGGESFPKVWGDALGRASPHLSMLTREDRALLVSLGTLLGAITLKEQKEQMQRLKAMADHLVEQAETERKVNAPLYQKLGVLAGLALAIALV